MEETIRCVSLACEGASDHATRVKRERFLMEVKCESPAVFGNVEHDTSRLRYLAKDVATQIHRLLMGEEQ